MRINRLFYVSIERIDNFKLNDCLKEVQCEEEGQKRGFEGISPD